MPCTDPKPSFQKRRFLCACALAATAALPAAALAERFPERPISFVAVSYTHLTLPTTPYV